MRTVTVTLHGGVLEKITISDGQTITTDSSGQTTANVRIGTFTFTGSISGKSFERTIDSNTTDIYVMPEKSIYWYGNKCGNSWSIIPYNGTPVKNTSVSYNTNCICVDRSQESAGASYFEPSCTDGTVNITGCNKIKYTAYRSSTEANSGAFLMICSGKTTGSVLCKKVLRSSSPITEEMSLSGVGRSAVYIQIAHGDGTTSVGKSYFYAIWLE